MTQNEKAKFIRELIANIETEILMNVHKMPDDWDGHELRRYIADKFNDSAMTLGRAGHYGKPYASRFREYKNEVLVRNL